MLLPAWGCRYWFQTPAQPTPGSPMDKWVGHDEGRPIRSLTLILPREGLDPKHPDGWRIGPYAFSYLHNWAPAGVDTANMLLLPFAEEQSGQTQGGCNKGPATVTSLSNKGLRACARRWEASSSLDMGAG